MVDIDPNVSAGFRWTGQPLIDFGVATLMEWCDLPADAAPEQLTNGQVAAFVDQAVSKYFSKPDLYKSVMLAFGVNFLNPSWKDDQKEANVRDRLNGYTRQPNPEMPPCPFFRRPSVAIVGRDDFPLIQGRGDINFYPGGRSGLAVSGQAMTAIQALIFGALRSGGRLMVLETDDRSLLRDVLRDWVTAIRRGIQLSNAFGGEDAIKVAPPRTQLVESVLVALQRRRQEIPDSDEVRYRGSATLYYFSNSGQGPSLELYSLSAPILSFIQRGQRASYSMAWALLTQKGWPKPKGGKKGAPVAESDHAGQANYFYTTLFALPADAKRIFRTYFYGTLRELVERDLDAEAQRNQQRAAQVEQLWRLTVLFMTEVMNVRQERIAAIKELAERLADVVRDDPRRYNGLLNTRSRWTEVRRLLLQLNRRELDGGSQPVLQLDKFLDIFEMGEDAETPDWELAWDLVLMHMMALLYSPDPEHSFFKRNAALIAPPREDEAAPTYVDDPETEN